MDHNLSAWFIAILKPMIMLYVGESEEHEYEYIICRTIFVYLYLYVYIYAMCRTRWAGNASNGKKLLDPHDCIAVFFFSHKYIC